MNHYSLLTSPEDLFQKVQSDFTEFSQNIGSTYKAMDCAVGAWHLTDWVFEHYEKSAYGSAGIGNMRGHFITQCPDLATMHDIATGSKHFTVSRPKSNMTNNQIQLEDRVAPTVAETVGADWLIIKFENGDEEPMYSLLNRVICFWKSYFEARPQIVL